MCLDVSLWTSLDIFGPSLDHLSHSERSQQIGYCFVACQNSDRKLAKFGQEMGRVAVGNALPLSSLPPHLLGPPDKG